MASATDDARLKVASPSKGLPTLIPLCVYAATALTVVAVGNDETVACHGDGSTSLPRARNHLEVVRMSIAHLLVGVKTPHPSGSQEKPSYEEAGLLHRTRTSEPCPLRICLDKRRRPLCRCSQILNIECAPGRTAEEWVTASADSDAAGVRPIVVKASQRERRDEFAWRSAAIPGADRCRTRSADTTQASGRQPNA